MRFSMSVLLCALLLGACQIGESPGSAGAGGGDGGTPPCDGKNDCNACSACAAQMACAVEIDACTSDAACNAIDECVTSICGADLDCREQCVNSNPSGYSLYDAATRCLYCTQCPTDCAGVRGCG